MSKIGLLYVCIPTYSNKVLLSLSSSSEQRATMHLLPPKQQLDILPVATKKLCLLSCGGIGEGHVRR